MSSYSMMDSVSLGLLYSGYIPVVKNTEGISLS